MGRGGGGENEHGRGGGKKPEVSFIAAYADIYIRLSFWQLSLMLNNNLHKEPIVFLTVKSFQYHALQIDQGRISCLFQLQSWSAF